MKILLFGLIAIPICWGSEKVLCPGGEYYCPDAYTCCKLPDGRWGCCPYPNAVCCNDHIHCCPSGEACNQGSCHQLYLNSTSTVYAEKLNVVCPEENDFCPENSTCCKHPTLETYSCCPLPNAVCCNDGLSCCSEFSSCDLERHECVPNDIHIQNQSLIKIQQISVPYLIKINNSDSDLSDEDIMCPDGGQCQSGYTCCPIDVVTPKYGCCPLPSATCCSDLQHCCRSGTICLFGSLCL